MRLVLRHLRRLHYLPEVILARDLFVENERQAFSHKYHKSVPKINDIHEPTHGHENLQRRYISVLDELSNNPEFDSIIKRRTARVQEFLGEKLPLEFPELLGIICGLSNMDIITLPHPAGSVFGDVFTQQDTLRQLGARFFDLHCLKSFVFSDVHYLSCNAEEIEESMSILHNKESLIIKVMNSSDLSDCVIPYRGVHSAGLVKNRAKGFRKRIKAQTCVASFYSMLGILVHKFGSEAVVRDFWQPKMLDPTQGLLRLSLNDKL